MTKLTNKVALITGGFRNRKRNGDGVRQRGRHGCDRGFK